MSPDLESLPGVGPQLAARIRARFKDDDAFFEAAARSDLQAIGAVDGITERRAVDLVLAARGDAGPDRFLATPAARKVHGRIMDRLLSYASTDTGRNRLRLLHPLPSPAAASAHIDEVLAAKEAVRAVDATTVHQALRRLRPLTPPAPRLIPGLMIVAESDAVHERLHSMGLGRWATLGTARDLQEAQDYDVVVLAYDEGTLDASGLPNVIDVSIDDGMARLCPASLLHRFRESRPSIEACAALAASFDRPSVAPEALELLDRSGPVTAGANCIRDAVGTIKAGLDKDLADRVADHRLAGADLLAAISTGRLPPDLQRTMDAVLDDGRRRLHEATGLRFQPFGAGFPLRIDDDEVDRVIAEQESAGHLDRFRQDQKTAHRLTALEADLRDEVRAWLDYDATFALGRFAIDHDLHAPRFDDALRFDGSVHLDLAMDPEAQRIAYAIGDDTPVAVLTGANSGGKSTLLEHLTQLVVMARMGLPVVGPAVTVPWLDEVHLVTARRGMDAGAFETFLRGFLPVTVGDARRLVLADEVEAVTELEAAGRILAWVLDRLTDTQSLAVVVTHLADQVMGHVRSARVRVDGIEATGLDDAHRLVVDRRPVMGRAARSTPELIIQRLAATTRGTEQTLYQGLLDAFQDRIPSTSHA